MPLMGFSFLGRLPGIVKVERYLASGLG